MAGTKLSEEGPKAALQALWRHLDKNDREIIIYLALAPPPVSIDTLSSLSGASAVTVLSLMEQLKRKGVVFEKRGMSKGVYFVRYAGLAEFIRAHTSEEQMDAVIQRVIDQYEQSSAGNDSEERTLALADLYRALTNPGKGLELMKSAAEILRRSGNKPGAASFYDGLLNCLQGEKLLPAQAELFLDAVIGKIQVTMHRMPVQEQIPLLTRAEKVAQEHKMWDRLAKIKLWLGRALQDAGHHRRATSYINDFLSLSQRIGDTALLKSTSHWVSEYFTWKGRFSEATRRYEEMVGDLEEFGDDEMALMSNQIIGLSYVMCGRVSRGLGMVDAVRAKAELLNLHEVVNYCDQTSIAILLELRKVPEAEFYLDRLSSISDEALGPFLAWTLCDHRAYILCSKQDYEGAFKSLKKKALLSRSMGRVHSPFTTTFETLSILESKRLVDKEVSLDALVNSTLDWDDIFTKGLAFRYRAFRDIERGLPDGQVLSDLEESERCLKTSGALIELARTRIALGKYYLAIGETRTAQQHLSRAWAFFSTIDSNLFPDDLTAVMPQEQKVKLLMERITRINESLGTIRDMSSFLERVIEATMDFTMALRASFIVRQTDGPRMVTSRNLDPSLLNTEKFKRIREMVTGTITVGDELVLPPHGAKLDTGDTAAAVDPLICMPAKLGKEVTGYLVLDGRLGNEPFPESLIPFVRMLCSQIAVGLNNIKIYEELKGERDHFEDEAVFYKKEMGIPAALAGIIGSSDSIHSVIDQIQQVAPTDSSVLIMGETGVGKELVAKAIHGLSKRKNGPFIPVNLAALPEELVGSELFGHEKGAFTGAHGKQKGRFELADGGTLFLDEIGDLPLSVQVKLLRVLQEGIFERLGGPKPIRSDFRIVAATNMDLHAEVEKGTFRQDLFYRLNVFPIRVPPLRERKDDIPRLVRHFADRFAKALGKRTLPVSPQELGKLLEYDWPGNIRELEHFIERAIIVSDGRAITFAGLKRIRNRPGADDNAAVVDHNRQTKSLSQAEKDHILSVLDITHGRISGSKGAASILGLKESTLRFRMKKLGIARPPALTKDASAQGKQ
jgi:transcriptional regulator with GAF, ATPase, and Fis domain